MVGKPAMLYCMARFWFWVRKSLRLLFRAREIDLEQNQILRLRTPETQVARKLPGATGCTSRTSPNR